MPRAIRYLKGLSPAAKLVLEEIVSRYNEDGERPCNLSRSQFAEFLDLAKCTVSVAIKELEKKTLIAVDRAEHWYDKKSNVYHINWQILLDPQSYSQRRRGSGSESQTYMGLEIKPNGSGNQTHGSGNQTHKVWKSDPYGSENQTRTIESTNQQTNQTKQNKETIIINDAAAPRREDLASSFSEEAYKACQAEIAACGEDLDDEPTGSHSEGTADRPTASNGHLPGQRNDTPTVDEDEEMIAAFEALARQ